MRTLLRDLRYRVRLLLNSRGFSAIAIVTLALGIGANTAIFRAINALLYAARFESAGESSGAS